MFFSDIDIEIANGDTDTEAAEILKKNIIFFCNTPLGSLPQRREFGIDYSILDAPFQTLRMRATVDIISAVRKFYGVQICNINITADQHGGVKLKIII